MNDEQDRRPADLRTCAGDPSLSSQLRMTLVRFTVHRYRYLAFRKAPWIEVEAKAKEIAIEKLREWLAA